jgi:poly-gamma-glutamate capsule biosynthesis protein CapA/YwtB (metallophosphatase superfamily)
MDPEKFEKQEEAVIRAKEMASSFVRDRAIMAGAKDVKVMVEADDRTNDPSSGMMRHGTNWIRVCARATGDPI